MFDYEINKLNLSIPVVVSAAKYKIIEFHGELDSYSLKKHREKVLEMAENLDKEVLVFDFSGLDYINSESISFLLQVNNLLHEKSRKLVLVQPKPNVKDVLDVIGIFETIPYYSTLLDFLKTI